MGVEEEYLLIGADGVPTAVAGAAIAAGSRRPDAHASEPGGDLEAELKQQQLETGTHPRADLGELTAEIRVARRRASEAATEAGARIATLATSPLVVASTIYPNSRALKVEREFAFTSREQLTCGCHVHISIEDDEEGVAVIDRIAPWLPVLLAMTANSPFWQGEDTGYSSFRAQVWNRWPTAGPVAPFGSAAAYHESVAALLETGTILDVGMVYFDARLSARYPTLEVRVPDVCLHPDDAVLVAALVRGLVDTAARDAAVRRPPPLTRVESLRAAAWRASRSGMTGDLVSPLTLRPVPAAEAVAQLVEHASEALRDAGDLDAVGDLLGRLAGRGNGAHVQRTWRDETGDLAEVVRRAADLTLA